MKRVFIFLVVVLTGIFFQQMAGAVEGKRPGKGSLGAGVIFGEPTGLTAKWWLNDNVAMDATAAWSFANDSAFQFHVDYLLHKFGLIKVKEGRLPVYLGFGGRVKFADDTKVGIRIPVGLSYLLEKEPIEVFGEIVPSMDLIPSTKAVLMGGLGVRYYFQ